MRAIDGAIVTLDALGGQREIAQNIIAQKAAYVLGPEGRLCARPRRPLMCSVQKAAYVLALKGNPGSLREEGAVFGAEQTAHGVQETTIRPHQTVDGEQGRIETPTTTVSHEVAWRQERHDGPGLNRLIRVDSTRALGVKTAFQTRVDIASLVFSAAQLGPILRSQGAVENCLHWVRDRIVRDDDGRVRTHPAPANVTTLTPRAHNLIRTAPGKESLRRRRKVAAWDDDFLASRIAA